MTLNDCITYFTQLLQACWGAFELRIWGVPIWIYLASIMIFALTVAFLKFVILPYLTNGGD